MKITVVIPTYKRLDYLSQAVKSVIAQTYANWECLIINDYPPDASSLELMVKEFGDGRLNLINQPSSLGGNAARNRGIKAAQGEIIAFLDDDDLWLPQKLEQHLQSHQSQNAQVVFSGVIQQWENDKLPAKTSLASLPNISVVQAISAGDFCPHTTSCVSVTKSCFTDFGLFDESLVSFQDWDMWYRIAEGGAEFACISEPLIIFRQHLGARTSKSIDRRLQGLAALLKKWQGKIPHPEEFHRKFAKESYICLTNDLILQQQKKQALQIWLRFLTLINKPFDYLQAIKLLLMIIFSGQVYGQILQTYRSLNKRKAS